MKKVFLLSICAYMLFLGTASSAQAYTVASTSAVSINDTTTLFIINFKIGFLNRESAVPIAANSTHTRDLSYKITNADGTESIGSSVGAVLSATTIKDDKYFLPRGKNGMFSLVVLHKHADTVPKSLKITELPFTLYDGPLTVAASVPSDSLIPFATPYTK